MIYLSTQAKEDIDNSWHYIALDNIDAADNWKAQLKNKLLNLGSSSEIGRIRNELKANLRSFPFGSYVIFYVEDAGKVTIVRVLHGARHIQPDYF